MMYGSKNILHGIEQVIAFQRLLLPVVTHGIYICKDRFVIHNNLLTSFNLFIPCCLINYHHHAGQLEDEFEAGLALHQGEALLRGVLAAHGKNTLPVAEHLSVDELGGEQSMDTPMVLVFLGRVQHL